jgi:hypothetical protein
MFTLVQFHGIQLDQRDNDSYLHHRNAGQRIQRLHLGLVLPAGYHVAAVAAVDHCNHSSLFLVLPEFKQSVLVFSTVSFMQL